MARPKKQQIKRGRDVTKVLRQHDQPVRNGNGSHIIGELPDGEKIVYYHGELSKGVRSKVVKALVAAGFLTAAFTGGAAAAAGGIIPLLRILLTLIL